MSDEKIYYKVDVEYLTRFTDSPAGKLSRNIADIDDVRFMVRDLADKLCDTAEIELDLVTIISITRCRGEMPK